MDKTGFKTSLSHGNFTFDVMACSAIGGGSLALFFLFTDIVDGRALFTPSLLGTVLFTAAPADSVTGISLSMVAGYTAVHFAVFALIGIVASILTHAADFSEDRVTPILLGIVAIEVFFFGVASNLMPGVLEIVGAGRVIMANVIAGAGIGAYLLHYRHQMEWRPGPGEEVAEHTHHA
jgi:hypothetical protein